jgi:hypothetical protein
MFGQRRAVGAAKAERVVSLNTIALGAAFHCFIAYCQFAIFLTRP